MLLSFNKCYFCIDCAYLSVNRVSVIGENSNFSFQLRADCIARHPFHTTCLSAVITVNRTPAKDSKLKMSPNSISEFA